MPAEPRTEIGVDPVGDARTERYRYLSLTALDCIDCPICGTPRPAEHPIADDATDDERLCVDCGAAVFVDPVVPLRAVRAHAA